MYYKSRIFSGKPDSVILLDFECTTNTQNLNKIVRAIFEKIEILIFFLCELPLILALARKRKKKAEDIYKGTPDIIFEQDWSVGLGAILADGQKIIVGLRMYYKPTKFNQNR